MLGEKEREREYEREKGKGKLGQEKGKDGRMMLGEKGKEFIEKEKGIVETEEKEEMWYNCTTKI